MLQPETKKTCKRENEIPLGANRLLFAAIKSSLFHYIHQCKNKQSDQDKELATHLSLFPSFSLPITIATFFPGQA